MYKIFTSLVLCSFLLLSNECLPQRFIYNSPKNNALLVARSTTIILHTDIPVSRDITANQISVTGSVSGTHTGTIKLLENNKTILFIPDFAFVPDEKVSIIIAPGMKSASGSLFNGLTLGFRTTPLKEPIDPAALESIDETTSRAGTMSTNQGAAKKTIAVDSLPSNFPAITIGTLNNPYSGKLLITNQPTGGAKAAVANFLMVLNGDGSVYKYKALPKASNLFKMEVNGELSYNAKGSGLRLLMDTAFTVLDTFKCGNGYSTDGHDFYLLPNGHALLFSGDPEPVDMSLVVPGGNPNATVTGSIIQEVDADNNVVFQWRSWDYLPITDSYFDLTAATVDYMHPNAITVDNDGNILFSVRHMSCILKIDRSTGDIMWILGGKANQFTFIGENENNAPTYFSYQHDVSMLPNGNLTLFDNGNQHPGLYSRGVEYQLDQVSKTATLVWEYRHVPDVFSSAMGSVQRLPNGNTLIGWGMMSESTSPVATEVHPDKSVALELFLPAGQISYRALKYQWGNPVNAKATAYEVLQGNTYAFQNATDTTGIKIKFTALDAGLYTNVAVASYPNALVNPKFAGEVPSVADGYFSIAAPAINSYTGEVHVALNRFPAVAAPARTVVYAAASDGTTFFPQPTSYDSVKGELVFTTSVLGNFVFGIPANMSALAPAPVSPANNAIVNGETSVKFTWGTRGIVQSYHLQIATDSLFSSAVVDQGNVLATSFTTNVLANNAAYFWRVNMSNSAGTSDWSPVYKIRTASPYLQVISPAGAVTLYKDSLYVLRWESNVNDTVNIMLYSNNTYKLTIADSVYAGTKAFLWQVPSSLPSDTAYKIVIMSISNGERVSGASNTITIDAGLSGVADSKIAAKSFSVQQNYPNPFNPSTAISFSVPEDAQVKIVIYNTLGQKIADLENEFKKAGTYSVLWNAATFPSGIYLYAVEASGSSGKKYAQVKKMLLLK
jgi:hypothetical protein